MSGRPARSRGILTRLLITGAKGFVGTYLCEALAATRRALTVITNAATDEGVALDLTDAGAVDRVVARERPDMIVHLAAQASVGAAQAGAVIRTWAVNLGGSLNLALAMARHAPSAIVLFASSSEVYGRAFGAEPLDEDAVPEPGNDYARSKLMSERMFAEVLPPTARLIVARPFNHSGAGQREDFVLPSFAGQIARIEAGLQTPVLQCGNLEASRDFLDVRDVAAAYVALIEAAPRLPARFICNIATGSARRLADIVERMRGLAHVPFDIAIDPARLRPSDIPFAAGCADRLREATGWVPTIPFDDTLAALLDDARRRVAKRR